MDNLRQTGKILRKHADETNQNIRRYSENFPQVERTVDSINPAQSFKKEFHTGENSATRLNLRFSESQKDCILSPIDEYIACETLCSIGFGPADGTPYPSYYDGFASNIGGFSLGASGGIVVPLSGIYNIRFLNQIAGVDVGGAYVTASVRRNGFVISSVTTVASCGGLCAFFPTFDVRATGVYCNAGDVVGGWLEAGGGYAFYTPSDFCGLFHGQPTIVELVAQP